MSFKADIKLFTRWQRNRLYFGAWSSRWKTLHACRFLRIPAAASVHTSLSRDMFRPSACGGGCFRAFSPSPKVRWAHLNADHGSVSGGWSPVLRGWEPSWVAIIR